MPWDVFCMKCGSPLAGGMADGNEMDQEIKAFDNRMKGKLMKCADCGAIEDIDSGTGKLLSEDEAKRSGKEIVELQG